MKTNPPGPGEATPSRQGPVKILDNRNLGPNELPRSPFAGRTVLYVQEVARHLRVTRQHILNMIEEGSLPAINVNGAPGKRNCWRIPVEAFQAFLKQRGG